MSGLLVAIVFLGILIFVHELGHFMVARLCDVGVERFSLGFGPKVWGVKKTETEYVLSLLPLGGYVKLLGENPEEELPAGADISRSFSHKPLSTRTAIVVAGPLFNLIFASLVMSMVYLWGIPVLEPVVGKVLPSTPAAMAGLMAGDKILAIEGKRVSSWDDLSRIIQKNPGKSLKLVVKRKNQSLELTVTPELQNTRNIFGEKKKVGRLGIVAAGVFRVERSNPLTAVARGIGYTVKIFYLTVLGVIKIIQRVVPAKSVGGPILIVQLASQQAKAGVLSLLTFMAFISVNLGVINLFPIPVLDGGHLLFFGIEAVRRKPLSVRTKEMAQQIGLAIIIVIMVLAFYNDIVRIIGS
jgi:regulator of sigma E protease